VVQQEGRSPTTGGLLNRKRVNEGEENLAACRPYLVRTNVGTADQPLAKNTALLPHYSKFNGV